MNSHTQIPSRLLVPYQISVMRSIWGACSLLHLWSIDKHVKSANNTLLPGRSGIRSPSKTALPRYSNRLPRPSRDSTSFDSTCLTACLNHSSLLPFLHFPYFLLKSRIKLWTCPIVVPTSIEHSRGSRVQALIGDWPISVSFGNIMERARKRNGKRKGDERWFVTIASRIVSPFKG